jgi:transposase
MYLRPSTRTKDGKTHTYWRLVRSVRRGRRVLQETVAYLGELDAAGRVRARALARVFDGGREQLGLFEAPAEPQAVAVRLDRVRVEGARRFGEVWLGWTLWRALKLEELCERLMPAGREQVPWATMAAILVIARLCEPSSELHIAEAWYRRTALDDVLGVPPAAAVNDDRLYRALDRLLEHKSALEVHLHRRLGELFRLDYELLLYDVTSTYFEGLGERNPKAQRGHSRDHRPDCKQVCIALVVTRDGVPLAHEIFEGNRVDVTTVEEIVAAMEARFGIAGRIWVMDRGMVSEENLAWLRQSGRRYLIGATRSELARCKRALLERAGWREVRDGVEVKLVAGPEGQETFLLCRSRERRDKEAAMHARFASRIEAGLERLKDRMARSRLRLDRSAIDRQIGRLLERNARAARRYRIDLREAPSVPAGLRLDWRVCAEWDEWAQTSEGCYVLRTNVNDWTPEDLWRTYIQLTQAEAAFRIQKSELSLRPIWHQREDRVRAHILVCFLAYVLWKALEKWMERAGLGNSPRTLLEELAEIVAVDVVLPTAEQSVRELRIRCVARPDATQAALLDRLGLRLPQRLRTPPLVAKM